MDDATRAAFERAAWAAAEGVATEAQLALLQADTAGWKHALERLLDETEDALESVQATLSGAARVQVVADFEAELDLLESAYDRLTGAAEPVIAGVLADPPDEVLLQATWSGGVVVVWAAGAHTKPADNDGLA